MTRFSPPFGGEDVRKIVDRIIREVGTWEPESGMTGRKSQALVEWKDYGAEIQGDKELLQIDAIISTETRDRQGDILLVDGMREPAGRVVVLMSHGMGPTGMEPVAKVLNLDKVRLNGKKGIRARIQFFPDSTGVRLYEKVRDSYMPNFSIGWIPYHWEHRTESDGSMTRVVTDWEILELSPVAVSANPEAQYIPGSAKSWFKFLAAGETAPGYKEISMGGRMNLGLATRQAGRSGKMVLEIPDELIHRIARKVVHQELEKLRGRVR